MINLYIIKLYIFLSHAASM